MSGMRRTRGMRQSKKTTRQTKETARNSVRTDVSGGFGLISGIVYIGHADVSFRYRQGMCGRVHDVHSLFVGLTARLFLSDTVRHTDLNRDEMTYQGKAVTIWDVHTSFKVNKMLRFVYVGGSISWQHGTIVGDMFLPDYQSVIMEVFPLPKNSTVRKWRKNTNPSVSKIQQIFFEVAKAIQYIDSLGMMLGYGFDERDVYVDSGNHVKVQCPGFCPNYMCREQCYYDGYYYFTAIHSFGILFYQCFAGPAWPESRGFGLASSGSGFENSQARPWLPALAWLGLGPA
ncbi:hypothetical protein JOM56_013790 [Amanita muscaria]